MPGIALRNRTVPVAPLQVCGLLKRLALNQNSCYAIHLGLEATKPEVHTKLITWDQPSVVNMLINRMRCSIIP